MIHRTALSWQSETWQEALKNLIRTPEELFGILKLDPKDLGAAKLASKNFALKVPRSYVARMEVGNPNDPLLRQILPLGDELLARPGYTQDPLEEQQANPHPGLIHKYPGRVLLIVTGSCAINCRYCFRRHFPYEDNRPNRDSWQQALSYIAKDESIQEVIFSGGDPLGTSDANLLWLTQQIDEIKHVKRLRVHSRLPIVLPARIDEACLEWLAGERFQSSMVVHCNHPNELNYEVAEALARLKSAGVTLLNQSVLLKGVNDDYATLKELSEKLFSFGVLPYYLHLLDKVQGAAHFDIPRGQAIALHDKLRENLSGYLVPKLVQEIAGEPSKTPVF